MPGYPVELFVIEPPEVCICSLCNYIFKSPMQCTEGHVFCADCIHSQIAVTSQCPVCDCSLTEGSISRCLLAKTILDSRLVKCSTTLEHHESDDYIFLQSASSEETGCTWIGQLKDLEDHIQSDCGYAIMMCPNDGCCFWMSRRSLVDHAAHCPLRLLECTDCHEIVRRDEIEQHDEVCALKCIDCLNSCGTSVPRENMKEHLSAVCTLEEVDCPNAVSIGCISTCPGRLLRGDLEKHVTDSTVVAAAVQHLARLIRPDQQIMKAQTAAIEAVVEKVEVDLQVIEELKEEAKYNKHMITDLKSQIHSQQLDIARLTSDALLQQWATKPCDFSKSVLAAQVNQKKRVVGETWDTHYIVHEFPFPGFTSTDQSRPFILESSKVKLGPGEEAFATIRRCSEDNSVGCHLYITGFRGTAEITFTAFRFGRGPPKQGRAFHVWDRDCGWGWSCVLDHTDIVAGGWVDRSHNLPILITISLNR